MKSKAASMSAAKRVPHRRARMGKPGQRSLQTQIDHYTLDARAQNCSPKTLAKIELGLRLFNDFMGGISDVRRVTGDDLRRYILDLQKRTRWQGREQADQSRLADETVRTYARVVKEFWSWLFKKRTISRNPMADVSLPRVGKRLPRTFSEADMLAIMDTASSMREWALICIFLDSGPRLCEVTGDDRHPGICMETIDFETGRAMVCGKFGDERPAHLSPQTIEFIRRYCQEERPQPVGPDKLSLNEDGTPMKKGRVQKVLEALGRRAGLKQRLSPHKLRHTKAVLSLKYGSNVEYQRKELGHHRISTTQGYLDVDDDDLAKAHRSYSPVTNLLKLAKGLDMNPPVRSSREKPVMRCEWPSPYAGLSRPKSGPGSPFSWELKEFCEDNGMTVDEYLRG
jgi:integrase/recombinase XerD